MAASVRFRGVFSALVAVLCLLVGPTGIVRGEGGRTIAFPLPPDPNAIGTSLGAINTHVTSVTLSPPASIHRLGLVYSEIRGNIRGVGWGGGTTTLLQCPYEYDLPYVLRIPPGWDGGLVIYRHEFDSVDTVDPWEATLGDRNFYRVIHETADRYVSDVALHPTRRWAFFAVNTTGVAPGGGHNTTLLDAPGCVAGTAVNGTRDATLARDHALLAQRLMKLLRGRDVTLTLGVGFVQGAAVNFALDAGSRYAADSTPAGDNHRIPYDPSSGRIFDGFLAIDTLPAGNMLNVTGLSAPTIFVYGEAATGVQQGTINSVNRMAVTGVDMQALARVYSLRNVPLLDADWNLGLTREDIDWANAVLPTPGPNALTPYYLGSGERLRPLMGALLDSLAEWGTDGIAPPPSLFNGAVKTGPDRIEFQRSGAPSTVFPYVDDPTRDSYLDLSVTPPNAMLRTAWATVRTSLGAPVGSIVLPETACRRGARPFLPPGPPTGGDFRPFDSATFLARWGSESAYNRCRVAVIDGLIDGGFYDPTFVAIDIDPDHSPNVVDLTSAARLAVGILSSNGFDATEVVPGSLRLAGASQRGVADNPGGVNATVVDLNDDGRPDLRVEFRIDRLRFADIDIVADLWGETRSGLQFSGSDLVQVVH